MTYTSLVMTHSIQNHIPKVLKAVMDADDGLMQAYISSTRCFEVGSIPFPT